MGGASDRHYEPVVEGGGGGSRIILCTCEVYPAHWVTVSITIDPRGNFYTYMNSTLILRIVKAGCHPVAIA